jgi:hypothetical protein
MYAGNEHMTINVALEKTGGHDENSDYGTRRGSRFGI